MKKNKRKIDLLVISDVHLGTYGCHAKELLRYLKSIKTKTIILNGDIIDMWQFKKRYWPKSHMKLVKYLLGLIARKTKIYYITGNHDETLRKFSGTSLGSLEIVNSLTLTINGEKVWFFHGDVFDVIMKYSKWLARVGAIGYDSSIYLNVLVNFISRKILRKGKVSLSKKVKENVKTAVKFINNFEETASRLAITKGYERIVCGHIHHPDIRIIHDDQQKSITYMNSGDWIENLSALEYYNKEWHIYKYSEDFNPGLNGFEKEEDSMSMVDLKNKELFHKMLKDFN
jgi:UDP-2,3-diacylglucosamine pyrophosphatase LpxH